MYIQINEIAIVDTNSYKIITCFQKYQTNLKISREGNSKGQIVKFHISKGQNGNFPLKTYDCLKWTSVSAETRFGPQFFGQKCKLLKIYEHVIILLKFDGSVNQVSQILYR